MGKIEQKRSCVWISREDHGHESTCKVGEVMLCECDSGKVPASSTEKLSVWKVLYMKIWTGGDTLGGKGWALHPTQLCDIKPQKVWQNSTIINMWLWLKIAPQLCVCACLCGGRGGGGSERRGGPFNLGISIKVMKWNRRYLTLFLNARQQTKKQQSSTSVRNKSWHSWINCL